MLKNHTLKIFRLSGKMIEKNDFPVYTVSDGKLFRTVEHPLGWSEQPDYSFENDGKLYRTKSHPQGSSNLPDYEFRNNRKIYRTESHPDGPGDEPEFVIHD